MALVAKRPTAETTPQWTLPSIKTGKSVLPRTGLAPRSPEMSGSSKPHRSGKSERRGRRAADMSAGTSDNKWTATEIAAYFGSDSAFRTPSLNSASSIFPSSRNGESYTSKSPGSHSSASSARSFKLNIHDVDDDVYNDVRRAESAPACVISARSLGKCYRFSPDYEEKKKRLMKGKFAQQLKAYFSDLEPKRRLVYCESEDEAYDTELEEGLGEQLITAERTAQTKEFGEYPEYKRLCKKYEVVPNGYFLRRIADGQEGVFDLQFRYLSFGDSYAMAKEIENQPSITCLNVEDNAIGPAGMMCFADMLIKNSYISEVNLSDNKLGIVGARLLKKVLLKNARLVAVNISGNNFGERGAKYLADVIDRNDTIKYLYMSHNAIGDNGATMIGRALGNNVTMRTLDLSWNHIRHKGAFGFSKGLKNNHALEVLNLSMNGLHVEGTKLLMGGLKGNESLRELDLSANRIDKEGADAVARSLAHMLSLLCLKMAFNPLTSAGAESIVKALINCPFSPMEFVDFEGVTLEDYFELLAEELYQQRSSSDVSPEGVEFHIHYSIPPSSRERSTDIPLETLTQVVDLMRVEGLPVVELFTDTPEDDQLIMSTEDLFDRLQKSGRIKDAKRLANLKQSSHRDLRRRFLLKDLMMLAVHRRQSRMDVLDVAAHALDTPELRQVQNAWRQMRPDSNSRYLSPFGNSSFDSRSPALLTPFTPEPDGGSVTPHRFVKLNL